MKKILVCVIVLLQFLQASARSNHGVGIHVRKLDVAHRAHFARYHHAADADIKSNVRSIGSMHARNMLLSVLVIYLHFPRVLIFSSFCCQTLRSNLMHRDTLQTGTTKSPSERFLNGVKRSHMRINRLENHLIKQLGVESEAAGYSESPVTASTGEYVMELSLGTPPQKFSTIVDTGSDLTWVQCSPCSVCFEQPNPLFDPRASSTYSQTKCDNGLCKVPTNYLHSFLPDTIEQNSFF